MRFHALLALAIVTGFSTGCATTRTADTSPAPATVGVATDQPIDADGVTIAVRGLSCPKCATGVDQQLSKIDGVRRVHVDLSTGDIAVDFDLHPRPTLAQLARAVEDSGFTLVSITPR